MIEIHPAQIRKAEVMVPGSKSYTHRMLIASALSNGTCTLYNGLKSEDTRLTAAALKQLGVDIEMKSDRFIVHGASGHFTACKESIYLGNSGTSMRFMTAVAALGEGTYQLTGSQRMQERPIQDLIDGLNQFGVSARSLYYNGCPPVEIEGGRVEGGNIQLNCEKSSQFLSALLLMAPYTETGLDITITHGPVSYPYIDMTVAVMDMFGVDVLREAYQRFTVPGGRVYCSGDYAVEPDASQAGYFWAAAAINGADIKVKGITRESNQGDVRLAALLEAMGSKVVYDSDGIRVIGGPLKAIETDMADIPDMVPTLAVAAAFAEGTTIIENVAHLAEKESNRLAAVTAELAKMGIEARCTDSGLMVKGGNPRGARIETYGDHRIAMSFALTGLRVPGVVIEDERCVDKSFPEFWDVFRSLYRE